MLLVVLALLSLASGSGSSSSRLSGRSDPHHEAKGGHPEDPAGEAQLEDVEARFFLKEKLCQLGLMECEVDALNYVQPVRVVPVGDPVPAVTLDKNYIPNIGYSSERSSYGAPQSSYGAPVQSGYGAPRPTYGAPKPTYEATKSSYGAPKPSYGAPKPSYGAPKPSYGAPKPSYGAPSYRAPKPTYGVSKQRPTYKKPSSSYSSYGAPSSGSSLSGPQVNAGATSSFGYGELSGSYSSQARPVREGRVDECYCLPVAQCPAGQVIGQVNQNKDYGALIDPRVKGSQSNISADPTPVTGGERRRRESSESTSLLDYQTQFAQRSGRSGEPFGPTGFRPPTCGGVSSGYVCCRLQVGFDFNELTSQPGAIRDIRQPNQVDTQFSSFGQCGRRNAHSTAQRINNPLLNFQEGDAEFGEYPWQAALLKKEQYDNVYVCGGSLIDNTHLITAAHCITQYRPEQLRVRLGEWDVNNDSEFYPNLELDVLTIKIHPEYTPGNLYNDIAILKLDGFIDFLRNPHISPVCLPDNFQAFTNYRCYVSGWGKDTFGDGGNYQHLLKEVDLPVLDSRDCENKLRRTRLGNDFVLHPGFMCAGGEEGKDSCKGDGGGPLVCEVGQVWYLAGIVSWGIGCGQRDVPGVYTKVNYYNAWIQESMLA